MDEKSTPEKKQREKVLTIHDCLRMIGMKELTANIYSIPSKKVQAVTSKA